jgi:hypothetical protein
VNRSFHIRLTAAVAGLVAVLGPAAPGPAAAAGAPLTQQGDNARESAPTPAIGFIDSPAPTCYQPNALQNVCYITVNRLYVNGGSNYITYMKWTINGQIVSYSQGFFQTSMEVPGSMFGNGFKVACGKLGAGGKPDLGASYPWEMRARDSVGLESANYGTAYCPAFANFKE